MLFIIQKLLILERPEGRTRVPLYFVWAFSAFVEKRQECIPSLIISAIPLCVIYILSL